MTSHLVRQFTELLECLKARGESARAFSLRKNIDKSTLNRLVNGHITQFDLTLIDKVVDGTDGQVNYETFAAFGRRLSQNPVQKRMRKRRRAA